MRKLIFAATVLAASTAMANENNTQVPAYSAAPLMNTAPCLDVGWRYGFEIGVRVNEQCLNRVAGYVASSRDEDFDATLHQAQILLFSHKHKISEPYKSSK